VANSYLIAFPETGGRKGQPMSDRGTSAVRFINRPELEIPPGYSHVVEVRGSRLIFLAGQAALDVDGKLVGGVDLEAQTEQAFKKDRRHCRRMREAS
jgi:enamine deaminase RidA (YjgF/YER057c/UK114 family)